MTDTIVTWTKIPLIGCPGLECKIDVTEDGRTCGADGEPLEMSERPFKCGADGHWMIGDSIFLCQKHAAEVAALMGDDIEEIFAAWKALL